MGVDFLKSKCKPFVKAWDAHRLHATESRLFGADSNRLVTSVVAKTTGPHTLRGGDEVLLRVDGDRLSILADLASVAVVLEPSASISTAIRESGGYARGTIEASYPTLDLMKVQIR